MNNARFDERLKFLIGEFQTVLQFVDATSPIVVSPNSSAIVVTSSDVVIASSADFTNFDFKNESAVAARGGPVAKFGATAIYAGYESLPPLNKNPILVSFTDGRLDWVRRDYETSVDESMAYGLFFDDTNLFAVFTSRGLEESSNYDFRRFAKYGWLSEYGEGEGNQIAVIAKIDSTNGEILAATFLSARQVSGETNSLVVTGLKMNGQNLVVSAKCWYSPRRTSRQPMDQKLSADNSPFDYEIEFTPNLRAAVRTEAPGFGQ
ncbi:hypothetical protein K9N08_03925 [Candidatus Gracilibacteria bacterium]|nr:hypothetical protein [Candidatus Gracilibacteria bacterium]MCF7856670.1 hypothetical protein [Candidatus Gracilibacteria bacterium]MCF7897001.1 hypothetical protein [Candidatus Gracilibacteria bacterium]